VAEVSVVIPVHNREHMLGPCIQSALDQTVSDLEVVIVDNASTDGTWSVCEDFARRDHRVRIFRNATNIGPVRNWQRCINVAQGKYAKILFSDDLMHPTFLERTLPLIQNEDVGLVFTMATIGRDPWCGQTAYKWVNGTRLVPSHAFMRAALFGCEVPVSPGAALFRLEDLRTNLCLDIPSPTMSNFASHGAGIDLLLYLLTARTYKEVAFVDEPLVFFRAHPGSITIASDSTKLRDYYTQARLWFASVYDKGVVLERTIAWAWLAECKTRRRIISPRAFVRRFLPSHTTGITLSATVWAITRRVARLLR